MKKTLLNSIIIALALIILPVASFGQNQKTPKAPKYVFLFIGDGMSQAHISLTEAYLSTQKGLIGNEPFSFTKFPVTGISSTYSANSFITCSAAAGTAISTGTKTNNLMLGVDPAGNKLTSITYKLKQKGFKIGIVTNVTLDQATPAAFYANSLKRNSYYDIAVQLPLSGHDFYGGGGFNSQNGTDNNQPNIYKLVADGGYKIVRGFEGMKSVKAGEKVVLVQSEGKEGDLPFAIDRKEGDLTLKQIVSSAISHLYSPSGFFIVAEGGKIDWSAHAHDGKTTIMEVLDFAEAIDAAYEFYLKHPDETLIIVTSDHDTGGVSVGAKKGYNLNLKSLDAQSASMAIDPENLEKYEEMNTKASIGWTTTSHSGVAVPVYSVGAGSLNFSGRFDNTDIPRLIFKSLNIPF
ncbi:MAG: alkaline phosphatase [Bacteroidetes bacterium HGW-Bacteroidetes-14]|nr:MAG: alkaline phosphatase [Bacteroidetes bacterium HGW-Bacteroidetes-14]